MLQDFALGDYRRDLNACLLLELRLPSVSRALKIAFLCSVHSTGFTLHLDSIYRITSLSAQRFMPHNIPSPTETCLY